MTCLRSPISTETQLPASIRSIHGMKLLSHYHSSLQDPINLTENSFGRASDSVTAADVSSDPFPGPTPAPVVPRTFVVTSLDDALNLADQALTLREAILAANLNPGADTINFAAGLAGTITLTQGQLYITDNLTINGAGVNNLTISGNNASRVFQIGDATFTYDQGLRIINAPTVTLSGVTITNGNGQNQAGLTSFWDGIGGGVLNFGTLTLTNSTLRSNISVEGGGIQNSGTLTVVKSMLTQNSARSGGAIANTGQAQIMGTMLSGNSALHGLGGAIFNSRNLTISGSTIVDNMASTNGGGIYSAINAVSSYVSTTITHTTIARNTSNLGTHDIAGNSFTSLGGNRIGMNTAYNLRPATGDVFGTDANPVHPLFNLRVDTLVDEMDGNFAPGDLSLREALSLISSGGTISFAPQLAGTITLTMGELAINKNVMIDGPAATALTISGNQRSRVFDIGSNVMVHLDGLTVSNGVSNNGGGIRINQGGELTLTGVMVNNNTATNFTGGGGIWNDRGTLTATNSTFSGNQAGFGGAILNGNPQPGDRTSTVTLTNVTLSGNQAYLGGAILNQIGSINLTSNTISNNTGTAVVNSGQATVKNTIIAGNTTAAGSNNPDVSGTFVSQGYNLIGNGTGSTGFGQTGDQVGTAQAPINPRLGALHDNGGTTWTMALLSGSPALNTGDPTLINGTDQRGITRSWYGRPDIGAFERPNTPPVATNDFFNVRNGRITFDPLRNDFDDDGDRLTITGYSQPQNGSLTRNADGSFTYQVERFSRWQDSFTYTITDGQGGVSTARVTFSLIPAWL